MAEIKRHQPTVSVPLATFKERIRAWLAPKMAPTPIFVPDGYGWGVFRTGADTRLMRVPGATEFASDADLWVNAWRNRRVDPYRQALDIIRREDMAEFRRLQRHAREALGPEEYAAGGPSGSAKHP